MGTFFTGERKLHLENGGEEYEVVPSPPVGMVRVVTKFLFNNIDVSAHTPTIRVKTVVEEDILRGDEYWHLYPQRAVPVNGWIDETAPVVVIGSDESLVIELAADPADDDHRPTVMAIWADERRAPELPPVPQPVTQVTLPET